MQAENGYHSLSSHFKWALDKTFNFNIDSVQSVPVVELDLTRHPNSLSSSSSTAVTPARVIILEEDLQIAPDFFEFFASTAHMLDTDKDLLGMYSHLFLRTLYFLIV